MRSRIPAKTRLDIAQSYANGRPVKVIYYEFGITGKTLCKIVRSAGLPFRHRYHTRNDLPAELEVKARDLFQSGRDTLTIARILSVTEAKVANALARARDRERAA